MQELNNIPFETSKSREDTSFENFIVKPKVKNPDLSVSNETNRAAKNVIEKAMSPKPDPHFHQATPQATPAAIQMSPNPTIDQIQQQHTEEPETQLTESSSIIKTMGGGDDENTNKQDNSLSIHTKLKIGQPGDKYEQEADAMTDQIMAMPETAGVMQRACEDCEEEEEEGLLQPKLRMQPVEEEEELFQPKIRMRAELTHIVQQNGPDIQRAPMPAEADVSSLSDYTAGTRQRIRYDTGYDLQSVVSTYFQPGIVMDVVEGYNVTYVVRGFPAEEAWLADPLKALALYTFNLNRPVTDEDAEEEAEAPPAPTVNISMVQNLDLSGQASPSDSSVHGPNARIRFTSTQFDATGTGDDRRQNVQLVIEKLGNVTAATASTETNEERRRRYSSTYQITNANPETGDPLAPPDTMSDSQFDQVLEALNGMPTGLLSRVTGIPVYRGLTARGPDGEAAEYAQDRPAGSPDWTRKITVYGDFFRMTPEQRTFTMIHEIGHALDYRPNETVANRRGGAALSSATGRDSFRHAVQQDGELSRGASTYAATSTDFTEYYAEAFAMYLEQPETLEALRPHVFTYFSTQYPSTP